MNTNELNAARENVIADLLELEKLGAVEKTVITKVRKGLFDTDIDDAGGSMKTSELSDMIITLSAMI